jgi:hypothetical protein
LAGELERDLLVILVVHGRLGVCEAHGVIQARGQAETTKSHNSGSADVALVRVEELRPLTLVTARSFPLRCHHGVRHHFSGSSLILSPPLATGTTQIGVASADELRSET